ncbi:hypothetical protein QJS04_geneDACA016926 [Acorus gramineus]|uniref:Uncharacterized protein n=1 Tax=Acorus gramineus TaxID=55184 RepID=A0AAV9AMM3_ACOGR|nr:hypothetical protein QJS04_geneDACA016926 [Acorus gramineus]
MLPPCVTRSGSRSKRMPMSIRWRVAWKARPLEEEVRHRGLESVEAERAFRGRPEAEEVGMKRARTSAPRNF